MPSIYKLGDKMIFIKIYGGLGNQLFQYAFGRSLSYDLNKKLYLDISYYDFTKKVYETYGLNPFNIKGTVGNYQFENFKKNRVFDKDLELYSKAGSLAKGGFFYKDLLFENMDKIELPAYFTGFYCNGFSKDDVRQMTENFFKHNNNIIKEDLKYLFMLNEECTEIKEDMMKYDSIAVHIRRGDYKTIDKFGTCSKKYFKDAMNEITKGLANPKFFIFTNDPKWFEKNFEMIHPHRYVDVKEKNGSEPTLNLKLMSLCKHFIISNSTFSWWGSWLGEDPQKKIIAPVPWFQSREILDVETIDNIEPIKITNNYKELFNESEKVLFKFRDMSDFKEIKNINFNFENNEINLNTFNRNSELILKDFDINFNSEFPKILKISMKTTEKTDMLKIYFETKSESNSTEHNMRYMWYYKNEDFDHYIILPNDILAKNFRIKPANNENVNIIIKDIEIREMIKSFDEI